jgi:hypothetical protein
MIVHLWLIPTLISLPLRLHLLQALTPRWILNKYRLQAINQRRCLQSCVACMPTAFAAGPTTSSTPTMPQHSTRVHVSTPALPHVPVPSTAVSAPDSMPPPALHTRLQAGIRKPKIYSDDTVRYGNLTICEEPSTLVDALADSNWKQAMESKFSALMKNNT